jgi:predicted lipoprotein with Yx(FWY)xxD motif
VLSVTHPRGFMHDVPAHAMPASMRNAALRFGLAGIALFRVAAMPSLVAGAIVCESTNPNQGGTMGKDHRSAATARSPWVVAAAAATLALLAAMIFLLDPPNTEAAGSQTTVVSTAKTKLGRILVDSRGHTLYLFGRDRNGKSACSGQCASFWPPLIAKSRVRAEDGAKASLIGRTKRADGRMQVTYNHHPLYSFVKDTRKGQVKGEGLKAFGGVWDAVSPAGKKVVSGGGGGY